MASVVEGSRWPTLDVLASWDADYAQRLRFRPPLPLSRSEFDVGAHRHDPVLRQVVGVDRAARCARKQQEQTLAPWAQARVIAADERDLGDEVDRVLDVEFG